MKDASKPDRYAVGFRLAHLASVGGSSLEKQ
jgi:hypothetical protein